MSCRKSSEMAEFSILFIDEINSGSTQMMAGHVRGLCLIATRR